MAKLKIALLQIAPTGTLAGNLEKGIAACKKAKALGADIALFPEMFSIGYDIYDRSAEEWTSEAINGDDDFVQTFGRLAAELDMAIGITFLEKYDPKPRNTLILFDRHGKSALKYSKVHTCDFSAESALSPGDGFYICDLDTAVGAIRVGAMICFDREFPESARVLMLKGAEVILAPNACPMEINRLSALRTRAYENKVAIATCNYPDSVPDCNGRSTVFDGVAWRTGELGVRDMVLTLIPCKCIHSPKSTILKSQPNKLALRSDLTQAVGYYVREQRCIFCRCFRLLSDGYPPRINLRGAGTESPPQPSGCEPVLEKYYELCVCQSPVSYRDRPFLRDLLHAHIHCLSYRIIGREYRLGFRIFSHHSVISFDSIRRIYYFPYFDGIFKICR